MRKFVNPMTDIGFKMLFGRENRSEEFLIDFINSIFEKEEDFSPIVKIRFLNPEGRPHYPGMHHVRFDLYCETSDDKRIIVEMQQVGQEFFMRRALYYVSLAISQQSFLEEENKGKPWEYEFMPVYGIFLCDFKLKELPELPVSYIRLCDMNTGKPVTNLMSLTFVQFPCFKKDKNECDSNEDMWFYILKNMENLRTMPFEEIKNGIFTRFGELAKIDKMTPQERYEYESAQRFIWDYNARMATAERRGMEKGMTKGMEKGMEQGMAKGIEKEKWEVARKMLEKGLDLEVISSVTNLSVSDIEKIKLK